MGISPTFNRYTAEVATLGTTAYTTTWGFTQRVGVAGNAMNIWDASPDNPRLIDSVIVTPDAQTLGDVSVSDDGTLMVVATEPVPGSIVIFDLSEPRHPRQITRYNSPDIQPGVHTAELGRINGRLYAFLAVDPVGSVLARLVILDITNPLSPQPVYSVAIGQPYVHDTLLRDGILFLALWDQGLQIWDVGGGGLGRDPGGPQIDRRR